MPTIVSLWRSSGGVPTHLCNALLAEAAANDLQGRGMRTLEVPMVSLGLKGPDDQSCLQASL